MAQRLIQVGFDPMDVLEKLGLPAIDHTGVPSVQLQNAGQSQDPAAVKETYGVADGN
jgi:hypothetical protein